MFKGKYYVYNGHEISFDLESARGYNVIEIENSHVLTKRKRPHGQVRAFLHGKN